MLTSHPTLRGEGEKGWIEAIPPVLPRSVMAFMGQLYFTLKASSVGSKYALTLGCLTTKFVSMMVGS